MVLAALRAAQISGDDGNAIRLTDAFERLPSAAQLPHYYTVIANPVDLRIIEGRLRCGEYSTVAQFVGDLQLMLDNALAYNDESSVLHGDASQLCAILADAAANSGFGGF